MKSPRERAARRSALQVKREVRCVGRQTLAAPGMRYGLFGKAGIQDDRIMKTPA